MLYYKSETGVIISVADDTASIYDADAEMSPSTQEEYDTQMAEAAKNTEGVVPEETPSEEQVIPEPTGGVDPDPTPDAPAEETPE